MRILVILLLLLGVALLAIGYFRPTAPEVRQQDPETPLSLPLIAATTEEKKAEIGNEALIALTAKDDKAQAAIAKLVAYLRDEDVDVRMQAMQALISVGRPALPALNAELARQDPRVPRDDIKQILAKIPKEAPPALEP